MISIIIVVAILFILPLLIIIFGVAPYFRNRVRETLEALARQFSLEASFDNNPALTGRLGAYRLEAHFTKVRKDDSYIYNELELNLFLPRPERLTLNIFDLESAPASPPPFPLSCEEFDSSFYVTSEREEEVIALLNESIREILISYSEITLFKLEEGSLQLITNNCELDFLSSLFQDMVTLLDHLTAEVDLKVELRESLLNDSYEGVRINCLLQLKRMEALDEEVLEAVCENASDELTALAAGELGRKGLPLLIDIFLTDERAYCKYISHEPFSFEEVAEDEETEFYYRLSPPLIALGYLRQYLDESSVREVLYEILSDKALAPKVDSGDKYRLTLNLLTEEGNRESIPHILNILEPLSGRLEKGSPFKLELLRYLETLNVTESNSWLLEELKYSSTEERLLIIDILRQFGISESAKQLEPYTKGFHPRELKEAAQQAIRELY